MTGCETGAIVGRFAHLYRHEKPAPAYCMDTEKLTRTVLAASARILRPLIRMLLRHGVGFNAFSDMSKRLFIEVAASDFALPGKKQTTSRISTLTGLSRKEVSRVHQLPAFEKALEAVQINRAARVISGWVRDKNYLDENGEPLDLTFEDDGPAFTDLVKQYSGDITARTIADELLRVGAISVVAGGKIRLNARAYIPRADEIQKIQMMGDDVADLIRTFDHNVTSPDQAYFQRKVSYDHITADSAETLRPVLAKQAQRSLETMEKSILGTAKAGRGKHTRRIGVGIYYFETEQKS